MSCYRNVYYRNVHYQSILYQNVMDPQFKYVVYQVGPDMGSNTFVFESI